MNNKAISLLGFAQRAGKLISGTELVKTNIRKNKIFLVILAEDTSERIGKDVTLMCNSRNVPIIEFGFKEQLGTAIGKSPRSVIGIVDRDFAKQLKILLM